MCSKNYGKRSKRRSRVLLVSLLLLFVVASQLAAWPIKQPAEKIENVSQEAVDPVSIQTIQEILSTQSSNSSEKPSTTESARSTDSLLISENNGYKITEDQYRLLVAEIAGLKETQKASKETESIEDALAEALADENKNLKESHAAALEINAEQADEIAELASEAKSKAYAVIGGVLGFDNNLPTYGVYGKIGTKIGKNLLLEAGAEYDIGSVRDPLKGVFSPTLDNFRVTAGVGWLF